MSTISDSSEEKLDPNLAYEHQSGTDFCVAARERFDRAAVMPEVRRLSGVSNWRSAWLIAFQWMVIVAAGWAAIASGRWWAYVLACMVIGSRQQALGVLVHDASHWLLFTNRTINDLVSDLLVAFPVGMSTTLYREAHFKHHRFTSSEQDPDWAWQHVDEDWHWPKTKREAIWVAIKSAFAINLPRTMKVAAMYSPMAHLFDPVSKAYPLANRILFVAGMPIIYGTLYATGLLIPVAILWAVPFLTLFNVLSRIRATAEHLVAPATHELNSTRTIIANWLERILIAPLGINYHLEHHLFPSVPGIKLHRLHDRLMEDDAFRRSALVTHSYWHPKHGLIGELLAAPENVPPRYSVAASQTPREA